MCDGVDSILQADLIAMGAGDVNAIVQKLSQPPVVRTPSVFKFSMLDHAAHYDIDAKIAIHTTALWCANMFNRRLARVGPLPKVEILSPIVLEFGAMQARGQVELVQTKKLRTRLLGECSLQKTGCKWIKYVNNDGSRNWTSMDPNTNAEYVEKEIVLDLFNLATAAWTGTNMVFADLQGVFHMGRFVLTDLAIAATKQLAFDQTSNLGEHAVKKIVREAREEVKGTPIIEFLTVFNSTTTCLRASSSRLQHFAHIREGKAIPMVLYCPGCGFGVWHNWGVLKGMSPSDESIVAMSGSALAVACYLAGSTGTSSTGATPCASTSGGHRSRPRAAGCKTRCRTLRRPVRGCGFCARAPEQGGGVGVADEGRVDMPDRVGERLVWHAEAVLHGLCDMHRAARCAFVQQARLLCALAAHGRAALYAWDGAGQSRPKLG